MKLNLDLDFDFDYLDLDWAHDSWLTDRPDRLVGYSDWRFNTIAVYVEDKLLIDLSSEHISRLRRAISDHVTVLLKHLFLSSKPAEPAQSRWTGVASVASFTLAFALFHNMLEPLFRALAAKDKEPGKTADTDADVAVSVWEVPNCQTKHFIWLHMCSWSYHQNHHHLHLSL